MRGDQQQMRDRCGIGRAGAGEGQCVEAIATGRIHTPVMLGWRHDQRGKLDAVGLLRRTRDAEIIGHAAHRQRGQRRQGVEKVGHDAPFRRRQWRGQRGAWKGRERA
jgi:hypothetical protein